MRLSRFERRIIAAIVAVGLVTLGGALWFGQGAVSEAYRVGVNHRVLARLDELLSLYNTHLTELSEHAKTAADAVAFDHRLRAAIDRSDTEGMQRYLRGALRHYPNVAKVVVEQGGAEIASVEDPARLDEDRNRIRVETRDIPGGRVLVTVATSVEPFRAHPAAGEEVKIYRNFVHSATYVSSFYLGVYIAFLLSVLVVALAVGIIVSRRVTRRVAVLAEATERVGSGDLTVSVPTDGSDEITELTRAFNAMVRDISESRDRIEYLQRIGAWQEFARRLAHEIKNPLTPIQLAVQEVHRTYKGDDARYKKTVDDAAAIVEEEVATLRRLVNEFSEFARLPVAALEEADLGGFVRDAVRGFEPAAMLPEDSPDATPPALELEVGERAMRVKIDAQMMRRALDNLVRNAVHAVVASAPEGGGRIIVAGRFEDGDAILEVRDNGPGIAPALRARVFDPYYTTKGEGTGLGLAIVKKVVLEHGGSIECGEAREGGAAFRIRLPAVEGEK